MPLEVLGRLRDPAARPKPIQLAEPAPDLTQGRWRRVRLPRHKFTMPKRLEGFGLGEVDYLLDEAGIKLMRLVAARVICSAISGKRV